MHTHHDNQQPSLIRGRFNDYLGREYNQAVGSAEGPVKDRDIVWSTEETCRRSGIASLIVTQTMEGNSNIPEIDLILTSSPVIARPRKMKARWSLESAFNLRTLHGLEAEVELTSAVGAEIRFEVDREIILDLTNAVPSFNLAPAWSKSLVFNDQNSYSSATGSRDTVGYTEHLLSFVNQLVVAGNQIFGSTGRATGQWVVIGLEVANIVETLPGFVPVPGLPNGLTKGVYMAGKESCPFIQ